MFYSFFFLGVPAIKNAYAQKPSLRFQLPSGYSLQVLARASLRAFRCYPSRAAANTVVINISAGYRNEMNHKHLRLIPSDHYSAEQFYLKNQKINR